MRVIYNKQKDKFYFVRLSGEAKETTIIFLNRNQMMTSIIAEIKSFANKNDIANIAIDGPFNIYEKTNDDDTKDVWVYFTEPASLVLNRSLDLNKI